MRIAIIGAAGMVGRKLTQRLIGDGGIRGSAIEQLLLADVIAAEPPAGFDGDVKILSGDFSARQELDKLTAAGPDGCTGQPRCAQLLAMIVKLGWPSSSPL